MQLTAEQIENTAHLSSRKAASVLGVGKTTVNKYRRKFSTPKPSGDGAITDPAWDVQLVRSLPVVPEHVESPETHVPIENDLEADGVSEETHKLSYSYSEWDIAPGVKGRSRRVTAVPIAPEVTAEEVDPHELLKEVRDRTTPETTLVRDGTATFVLSLNDWQYGKVTMQGGTVDTTEIVVNSINKAKARIEDLERMGYNFGELIIIFGGDLAEGCNNTPQGAFGIELARKQQIEGCVSLALVALDTLAPLFDNVQVIGVRGNHGENRINGGKPTTPEDNDDTLIVSMAALAAKRDEKLKHIEFLIAEDEAGMLTTTLSGWKLGTTHGDVYGKGVSGATTERKVNAWYKNMAAGRDPLGQVDVMVTHHYHHSQSADYGSWEWHQTPAQDGALSEYFRQASGNFSEPGALTFVMAEERYMEPKIV